MRMYTLFLIGYRSLPKLASVLGSHHLLGSMCWQINFFKWAKRQYPISLASKVICCKFWPGLDCQCVITIIQVTWLWWKSSQMHLCEGLSNWLLVSRATTWRKQAVQQWNCCTSNNFFIHLFIWWRYWQGIGKYTWILRTFLPSYTTTWCCIWVLIIFPKLQSSFEIFGNTCCWSLLGTKINTFEMQLYFVVFLVSK